MTPLPVSCLFSCLYVFPKPNVQNIPPSRTDTWSAKKCHPSDCLIGWIGAIDCILGCRSEEPLKKPDNHNQVLTMELWFIITHNIFLHIEVHKALKSKHNRINAIHKERHTHLVDQKLSREEGIYEQKIQ